MNRNKLSRFLGQQIRDHRFETDDVGAIRFQDAGLMAYGVFEVENLTRGGKSIAPNLVVTEGLNHILAVTLGATAKTATWYLAPFAGNVTPAATWTAAGSGTDFATNASEFINYDETARPEFIDGAVSAGSIDNLASKAEITIGADTATQDTIWGVGLLSSAVKNSSSSGVLLSAAKLASSRANLLDGDVIALGYTFTVSDAG